MTTESPENWTPARAQSIASRYGIVLGCEHWSVIAACREEFLRCGALPSLPQLARLSGVAEPRLHDIFLVDPRRTIPLIAGFAPEQCRPDTAGGVISKGASQ